MAIDIVDLTINSIVIFHSYGNVYQKVITVFSSSLWGIPQQDSKSHHFSKVWMCASLPYWKGCISLWLHMQLSSFSCYYVSIDFIDMYNLTGTPPCFNAIQSPNKVDVPTEQPPSRNLPIQLGDGGHLICQVDRVPLMTMVFMVFACVTMLLMSHDATMFCDHLIFGHIWSCLYTLQHLDPPKKLTVPM